MRPLIGITCSMGQSIQSLTQDNPPQLQHRMNETYIKAVIRAGGIPVILPNSEDLSCVEELARNLDGFLLSGGDDVDPALFGCRATGKLGTVVPRRDAFEIALVQHVIRHTNKPILGICRGIQVLNVALGGSLHIDLPDAGKLCHSLTMYPRWVCTHPVTVTPGSLLSRIMDNGRVNSFHHQAIDVPGEGLTVTALSEPDQVIEAVELAADRFVVGVQWHPEELTGEQSAEELFRRFVDAAARK